MVDDNRVSGETVTRILQSFSFDATLAESGKEAIDFLEKNAGNENTFELVLVDWRMPGMDGIEMTKSIRSQKEFWDIPTVIMVTDYEREEAGRQAEDTRISGFLNKPVSPSQLFNVIMELFHNKIPEKSQIQAVQKEKPVGAGIIRGLKVLLAEDNRINQQVAKEIREAPGVEARIAENGREALNMRPPKIGTAY